MSLLRFPLLLLFTLCTTGAFAAFDPEAMRVKSITGAAFHFIGYTGFEMRDVDGAPGDELLLGYPSMWHLLKWESGKQTFTQIGFYEDGAGNFRGDGRLAVVRFAQLDPTRPVEIAALSGDAIGLFNLEGTLRVVWVPEAGDIRDMFFADIGGAEGDEVVLQTCEELSAWQFGSKTPLWRVPVAGCSAVKIGQVDDDPQPEIVLGSGIVFDSRTAAEEWRYPLGFGSVLAVADINHDGAGEIIGCRARECAAYDVANRIMLWQTFLPYMDDNVNLSIADVDFDGIPEIFGGDSQHGVIRKMSAATGDVLDQFEKSGGTNFVVVGNLDGDCDFELVWAKDGDSTAIDTFFVTDPATMTTFWSSVREDIGSSGLAFGDFSGTGDPSLLWANQAGSVVRFVSFDPPGQTIRSIAKDGDWYAERFQVVAAAQLDSDPALEYVLPRTSSSVDTGPVAVHDGATHALQWAVEATEDTITSMTTGDLTGDGVPEIIIGSSILYFPAQRPPRVVAIDGATRRILWWTTEALSSTLTDACDGCIVQVASGDADLDGRIEVLALVPSDGLYAFDGSSGRMLWHRAAISRAWAFTLADIDASPGSEIVVPFQSGMLAVFDASGTKKLRETDLSAYGLGVGAKAADLDGDGVVELVVVARGGLLVLSSPTLDVLWSGGSVLPMFSLGNQFLVADVDGDASIEVVVPSVHSLHVFEYRAEAIDSSGPLFREGGLRATAMQECCGVTIEWAPASDSGSMPVTYRLYRSTRPEFAPDARTLLHQTTVTSYVDVALARGQQYHYAVTAVDRAGNETIIPIRGSATAPQTCRTSRQRAIRGR